MYVFILIINVKRHYFAFKFFAFKILRWCPIFHVVRKITLLNRTWSTNHSLENSDLKHRKHKFILKKKQSFIKN